MEFTLLKLNTYNRLQRRTPNWFVSFLVCDVQKKDGEDSQYLLILLLICCKVQVQAPQNIQFVMYLPQTQFGGLLQIIQGTYIGGLSRILCSMQWRPFEKYGIKGVRELFERRSFQGWLLELRQVSFFILELPNNEYCNYSFSLMYANWESFL